MTDKEQQELNINTLLFSENLKRIIIPKDQSDRTTFRNIADFLKRGIMQQKYTTKIFMIVLGYAEEAAGPQSRNPAAVFIKILKDEISYGTEKKTS